MTGPKKFRLTKIRLHEISLVDAGADENALVTVFKRKKGAAAPNPGDGNPPRPTGDQSMPTEMEKMTAEMEKAAETIGELTKKLEAAEAARVEAVTKAEKAEAKAQAIAKAKAEDDDEDAILKAADPLVAEEIIRLRKANAASAKALAAMAEEGEVRKAVAHVAAEFPNLPVKAEDFGPLFKRATGALKEDDVKELTRILKAANSAIAEAAQMQGQTGLGQKTDAEAEIEKLSAELAKSSNISKEAAWTKVLEANPALYSRYMAERAANVN